MPITVFDAIKGNIRSFLGGAEVDLVAGAQEAFSGDRLTIFKTVTIEEQPYTFTASRLYLDFTSSEERFCKELLTAFTALYEGFRQVGYAAHFRTALLASIMDITVARSLRGDSKKGFWPIQQLVQLLKNLSYQRYEDKPATSGFIVHRTTLPELNKLLRYRKHTMITLKPSHTISADFFENPLTYRFIDGNNLFFVANILMQVTGVIRTSSTNETNEVERLTHREIFSIVRSAGAGAFAVKVNESSEIEIMTTPDKLLVRRKGFWAIFDPDIIRSFLKGSIDAASADDLIWTIYALSKLRHGTVVLIYNGTARKLDDLKKGYVGGDDAIGRFLISRVKGRHIGELKQAGTLLRILSSDGMTIFNRTGKLMETGFIIDTSHAREVVTGGGRTTAASAASFFGKVIKVSQDGPVELYHDGRLIYRFG
jgi:hypothetical protein